MAAKVSKTNAATVFGEFIREIAYKPTKGGGEVKKGEEVVRWKWDKNNDMPRGGGKMLAIGKMCPAFAAKYPTAKQKADQAKKVETGKGTTDTGAAPEDKRKKKTEAAYWTGCSSSVLNATTSAIAEAMKIVSAREQVELARRTIEGMTKLKLPVPAELAALVTPPKAELTALAEAPKAEAEAKPQELSGPPSSPV